MMMLCLVRRCGRRISTLRPPVSECTLLGQFPTVGRAAHQPGSKTDIVTRPATTPSVNLMVETVQVSGVLVTGLLVSRLLVREFRFNCEIFTYSFDFILWITTSVYKVSSTGKNCCTFLSCPHHVLFSILLLLHSSFHYFCYRCTYYT